MSDAMATVANHSEWSPLHDLAMIYLALAHGTDMDIDPAEEAIMAQKLQAWYPDATVEQAQKVFHEALLTYVGEHSRHMIDTAIVTVKELLTIDMRIAVLNDLAELASADGAIVPGEISFIQQLAEFWDVAGEIR